MSGASRGMDQAVDAVRSDLAALRTDRAHPGLIERVPVPAYGGTAPLSQLASIGVPSARQLLVTLYDESLAGAAERALIQADLGGAPQREGGRIRINLPSPSGERRAELQREAKAVAERGKVAVRMARRDEQNRLKCRVSEGTLVMAQVNARGKHLQTATDEHVAQIDVLLAAKLAELGTV